MLQRRCWVTFETCVTGDVVICDDDEVIVVLEPAAAVLGRLIFMVGDTAFAVADVPLPGDGDATTIV